MLFRSIRRRLVSFNVETFRISTLENIDGNYHGMINVLFMENTLEHRLQIIVSDGLYVVDYLSDHGTRVSRQFDVHWNERDVLLLFLEQWLDFPSTMNDTETWTQINVPRDHVILGGEGLFGRLSSDLRQMIAKLARIGL